MNGNLFGQFYSLRLIGSRDILSVLSFHVLNQEQVIGLNIITSNNQPPVQLVLFYLVKSRLFPLIGYHKLHWEKLSIKGIVTGGDWLNWAI